MSIDVSWLSDKVIRRTLSGDEQDVLSRVFEAAKFGRDEKIVSQGEPGEVLYLLQSGKAKIESENKGNRIHIATAGEGALFGEITFLTGDPASANVIASDDCVVYKLQRSAFSQLMETHKDLVYSLFAYMLVHEAVIIRHMNEEHIAMLHYITGRRV